MNAEQKVITTSPDVIKLDPVAVLKSTRLAIQEARDRYEWAIQYAVSCGLSNVKIAQVLGISEAAVRNYRKRHRL